ncbi:MAG: hypothetical protein ACNA71_03475 [Kiritimatiellia bacterium]
MKFALPADRNEKIKILIMIGLFGAMIGYALINFLLLPFLAEVKAKQARLDELRELLWRAETEIQQIAHNRNRNIDTVRNILDISEQQRFILRPSLGNYLLVAEASLLRIAEETGISIANIREASAPPPATDGQRQTPALWPYSVSFTLHAGLHDLARLVHHMHTSNPYLALTTIAIQSGATDTFGRHNINITVQWPVWRDPEFPNRLAAELLTEGE